MYRRYTTLHLLVTLAAFSVAAVWIALSAARHNNAKTDCQSRFFSNTTEPSEANTLCDIFPWVDVGLMAGLWVLLAVAQVCLLPISLRFTLTHAFSCTSMLWFHPMGPGNDSTMRNMTQCMIPRTLSPRIYS